jgi:hypothetical protein
MIYFGFSCFLLVCDMVDSAIVYLCQFVLPFSAVFMFIFLLCSVISALTFACIYIVM